MDRKKFQKQIDNDCVRIQVKAYLIDYNKY